MQPSCPSSSPSASSTPSSAGCCATAWTRSRANAPRSTSRPRCSCSTTPPRTARRTSRASTRSTTEVIALPERRGKAANDSALLQRARGRFCLLLNEDSELEPGATVALHAALAADERAGAAGAMLVRPDGEQQPSAWRFPSPGTALLTALFLHKQLVVQSTRRATCGAVDWVQSAAMLVRREAAGRDRLLRPAVLRLLRRGRLLPAPRRRRLAHALRPGRPRRAPRAALDRQRPDAADRRVLPQPRPLHAQAPLGASRPRSCAT